MTRTIPSSVPRTRLSVGIFGGTGVVGRPLARRLVERGHEVVVFSRRPDTNGVRGGSLVEWNVDSLGSWATALCDRDVVVHLARPALPLRLTDAAWLAVSRTRLSLLKCILRAVEAAPRRPSLFVCGSSHDYYGHVNGLVPLDEAAPSGHDPMARMYAELEGEATRQRRSGVRVVPVRISSVLGRGAPFPFRLTEVVQSLEAPYSWVSLRDVTNMLVHIVESVDLDGPVNLSAPAPTTAGHVWRQYCSLRSAARDDKITRFGDTDGQNRWLCGHWSYPAVLRARGYRWLEPGLTQTLAYLGEASYLPARATEGGSG